MSNAPRDFGMFHPETGVPGMDLQQRAFAALAQHPLFISARAHTYFNPAIWLDPKSAIQRTKWASETKRSILEKLADSETVLLLCCMTSDSNPQPLAGGGMTYDFALHPETLEILHSSTGTWRS